MSGRLDTERTLRVGYLLRMYPRFSQTFVVNEILELERQRTDVHILSLRKPTDGRFQEVICRVKAAVDYLPVFRVEAREKFRRAMWSVLRAAPGAYARALTQVLRRPGATLTDLRQAALLVRVARKRKLDHLHVHFGTNEATVAWMAQMLGGPSYSLTLHAFDIFRANVDRGLLALKINDSKRTVTVSEYNRNWMVANLPGVDPDKIVVNYNGIDLQRFAPGTEARDPNLIVGVGRLIEKKGFIHLIRAAAQLRDRGLSPRCVIVGDGPQHAELQREIKRLGVGPAVELTGALTQERVRTLMARARCVTLPCVEAGDGNVDALPTVLLEAMASGCACVSTRISGVPEIIDDPHTGRLVQPHDHAGLADALEELLRSESHSASMGRAGRRRAEQLFDIRHNVARMKAMFDECVNGAAVEPAPSSTLSPTEAAA